MFGQLVHGAKISSLGLEAVEVNGISERVGGLVGYSYGSITSSYSTGTGRTTAQMQKASTFLQAGWDFVGESVNGTWDIWRIDEGEDVFPLILLCGLMGHLCRSQLLSRGR